jgi:hypothetical protein
VNNRKAVIIRNGREVEEKWRNVQVGDIIRMVNGEFVAVSKSVGLCAGIISTKLVLVS